MHRIDLEAVVAAARLPGSQMIPAAHAVRSLLALKLIGTERKSHVMDLVMDEAIALFAGLNVVPKRSYLAAYCSRIDHKACLRFMEAWLEQVEQAGLPTWVFVRPRLSQRARQLGRGTPGKTLCFQPQPLAEGDSGLPGSRCRTTGPVLCQRRCHQGRAGRRDPPVRTVLEKAHRQTAGRTGLRFATDHLREAFCVEPGGHPFHHPAPPVP